MRRAPLFATTLALVLLVGLVGTFWDGVQTLPGASRLVLAAAPRAGSSQAGQLVTSAAIAEASTAYAVEVFSSPEHGATSFTVPAGHRFVVEQLSGWCNLQNWFAVRAGLNGQQFTHFFNTITNVAGAGRVFNIMTKFYVDDSGSVLPSQIPAGGCGVTMSGFLVSM